MATFRGTVLVLALHLYIILFAPSVWAAGLIPTINLSPSAGDVVAPPTEDIVAPSTRNIVAPSTGNSSSLAPVNVSPFNSTVSFSNSTGGNGTLSVAGDVSDQGDDTALAQSTPEVAAQATSSYWVANILRQGNSTYNSNPLGYMVYRNVKDYGAKGDGVTDDTVAINTAASWGGRCGQGCDSSTTSPALIYFPPGTYIVSKPIIQYYFTQFVGDALTMPTIKAAPSFTGIAVIDADPYDSQGNNWYTNQNNFYRQVRNFIIDLTAMPPSAGAGIHWQVAQATSLQNIRFEMVKGGSNNKQIGIFMDNGSGGFMADLSFSGGQYGAFLGNQQFTSRNLVFDGCQTAIFMNWNWLWAFKSLQIYNCQVGIDMASGTASNQSVGSITVQDSFIVNTPVGIYTAFDATSVPVTGGTLVIDNVEFQNCPAAVSNSATGAGSPVLAGNQLVQSWIQGKEYSQANANAAPSSTRIQASAPGPSKPAALLDANGKIFERSKPQYEQIPASSFLSAKSNGAKADGVTDDTAAIQALFNKATANQVVYFDHGTYLVSNTIKVPKNIKITGEIWPVILASGTAFNDINAPVPVFQVGQPGDTGAVEISDLIFSTAGPQVGAILVEWNVHDTTQGGNGLWDVHWRIGGASGTLLQSGTNQCFQTNGPFLPACFGAFMLLHITSQASVYLENTWLWVADHDLDESNHGQLNLFNGRGMLVESQGPVWMYGTAAEHSTLYQYQISRARNIFMSAIQSETPYFQSNPKANFPFLPNAGGPYNDPTFTDYTTGNYYKAWGLRVVQSLDVLVYGAGLYSFFDQHSEDCLATESCQSNMVEVAAGSQVSLYGLSTKGSTNMVSTVGGSVAQADNVNGFCSTLALFADLGFIPGTKRRARRARHASAM